VGLGLDVLVVAVADEMAGTNNAAAAAVAIAVTSVLRREIS
jgi:uncharacterized protein (DUF2267 family)